MKKHSFLAGMLTMALIVGLGMSALAATGSFTITVDPVNIQVNGTTFAPKDAKGNDVPVFAYGGTTYAPLRALAEAYGLTVGYDGTANMATVSSAATSQDKDALSVNKIVAKLVRVDGKYYYTGTEDSRGSDFTTIQINGENLLFVDDISINTSGIKKLNAKGEYEEFPYCTSWLFNYILRLSLIEETEITKANNPYVDGIINIKSPGLTLDGYLTAGVDATEHVSADKSVTPMWVEYNGKRLYRQNDLPSGLSTINGIRYYNGDICMNDVLLFFGINKTISFGEYSGTWYIEVK